MRTAQAAEAAEGAALTVSVRVKDFTRLPGPRYRRQGPDSGEAFREDVLSPAIRRAQAHPGAAVVEVDLDGTRYGFPAGWLEEVFGGAVRAHGGPAVERLLRLAAETTHEPGALKAEVRRYMRHAAAVLADATAPADA